MGYQGKRARGKKRAWIIAFVILLALAAVAFWQRDNLKLLKYVEADPETLQRQSQENAEADQRVKKEYDIPEVTLSPEEEQDLESGKMTAADAADNLLKSGASVVSGQEDSSKDTTKGSTSVNGNQQKLRSLLTQLYILRSSYTSRVEAAIESCRAEFDSLDNSQKTSANKAKIISKKIGVISSMEDACDSQVNLIVKQIKEIDPALASQVKEQYEEEKVTEKANLISQYS